MQTANSIGARNVPERGGSLLGARVRHSAHGKGHDSGNLLGSTGSSAWCSEMMSTCKPIKPHLPAASSVPVEKTLESPLDCKEIKPVNPKGNQP